MMSNTCTSKIAQNIYCLFKNMLNAHGFTNNLFQTRMTIPYIIQQWIEWSSSDDLSQQELSFFPNTVGVKTLNTTEIFPEALDAINNWDRNY